jgi:Response regulator containing CheY-like receiver, AAA-type ATPase, and DNA-binding domains
MIMSKSLNLAILLIDDDTSHREILSGFLKKLGCQVNSYPSGEEGISALKNRYADVVISDFRMPGMNGLEVLKQIKRDKFRNSGDNPDRLRNHRRFRGGYENGRLGLSVQTG